MNPHLKLNMRTAIHITKNKEKQNNKDSVKEKERFSKNSRDKERLLNVKGKEKGRFSKNRKDKEKQQRDNVKKKEKLLNFKS